METTHEILGLDDAEYGLYLTYDRAYRDGVNGNACDPPPDRSPQREKYLEGWQMGRRQLRMNYQRSLMNDYGPVPTEA